METPLWVYDASRQAIIFFDPARGGQGVGFHVPAIERAGYWEPKGQLEISLRKVLPRMPGPSMIQPAAMIPQNARRR